jgi:transcription elongation factor Elf1
MGGSKKSSTKPAPKVKSKLAKTFNCPFCSHARTVEVKLNKKGQVGTLACRVCGVDFQMRINHLHSEVDIFAEWIDQCAIVNKQ